jgi:flagellar basal-body rod protein FlgF
MSNGIYVALSGAMAQSTALDVAANNIANANTSGYHAERMRFSQVLSKAKDSKFVTATSGITDNAPGTSTPTGNPLDASIQGDGYFTVAGAGGQQRYTRDGSFRLDGKGQLATSDGHVVLDTKGKPLVVPPDSENVSLSPDGTLSAGDQQLGKIALVKLDPKNLKREGASLFSATGKPLAGPAPTIAPGSVESANFNVVHGVVDLVRISRNYEALHKMIESYKDMDGAAAKISDGG